MTNVNTLLQKCFELLNRNDYAQVLDICFENKLKHPSFELLMAVAKGKLGKYDESHKLFNKMQKQYPKNPDILYNQGLIFKQQEEYKQAQKVFELILLIQPNYHQAFHALANIQFENGNQKSALNNFTSAWNILPNNPEYIRSVAKASLSLNYFEKCFSMIETLALSTSGNDEDMLIALEALYQAKANDNATRFYELAIVRYPDNAEFLLIGGLIEIDKKRIVLALELLEKAKDKSPNPNSFDIEANLKFCRFLVNQDDRELEGLDKLIAMDSPEEQFQFICNFYETLGNVPVALSWIDKGLESHPQSRALNLLKAKCFLRLSRFDDADSILTKIQEQSNGDDISVVFEKIKLNEAKEDYKSAAECILRANSLSLSVDKKEASNAFLQMFKTKKHEMLSIDEKSLQSINQQKMVFIVGFPRSGTTLLESHFAKIENTVVLEETHALRDMFTYLEGLTEGLSVSHYLEKLDETEINYLANTYLDNLKKYVTFDEQNLLIDKMPLNGLYLSVINKLFPMAQVIWIRRDPRDVCISCLKQPMVKLHTVNEFIESYDHYFEYLDGIQKIIRINWVNLRYEDLVADFEMELEKLLSELNIDKVYGSEKSRLFNTPSYAQVTQKIYTNAVNHYQKYEANFDFNHILFKKWIEKLGYK